MSDGPDPDKLDALAKRIEAAKAAAKPEKRKGYHESAAQVGWRMVIELVVGTAMGFGIGYGLDSLFGTIPIFLMLFTLLGFAAGVRTMMRSAAEIQQRNLRRAEEAAEEEE
jgi:ATP synthase protein I